MSTPSPAIRRLRDYVAIPSVNPMRRSDLPREWVGERRLAEHLREELRGLALDAQLLGDPERPSVLAEARVQGARETLLVASHIDTVPVDTMEIPPFDPVVSEGRLYGRGSCDTKAGMASLLDALAGVLERGTLRRNLIVVGEADEELGSSGANAVLEHLADRRPSWVLATEPTALRVVNRHKGIALVRLRARGRACHSSQPERGRNAIVALAKAVLAVDELGRELGTRVHPQLGSPTLSVGLTGGGQAPNIVPDDAWFVMDRRVLPGESVESLRVEIEAALERAGADDVALESCELEKPALETAEDHVSVRSCQAILGDMGHNQELASVGFGTDAGVFAQSGLPGIVMGPGSIAQAHTAREFVETEQVEAMSAFFTRLLEAPTGAP